MNLEIINKLYLELSQITTAKTGSENYLEILLEKRDKDHAKTIAQLQADNAKLRATLGRYGKHDSCCGEIVTCVMPCDCGFHKALGETE